MDDEQRARAVTDAREHFKKMREYEAENGPVRDVTCPFCGTDHVRTRENDLFPGIGWGFRVHLPKGKTMAEMRGEISTIEDGTKVAEWYCAAGHRWRMRSTVVEEVPVSLYDRWDVAEGPITGVRRIHRLDMPAERRGDVILTPLRLTIFDNGFAVAYGLEFRLPSPDVGHSPHAWYSARDDAGTTYQPNSGVGTYHRDEDFTDPTQRADFGPHLAPPLLPGGKTDGIRRLTESYSFTPALAADATTLFFAVTALGLGRWNLESETQRQKYVLLTTIEGPWSFAIPIPHDA